MKILIQWPGLTITKTGGWDSAEVTLEMSDGPIAVSAFVGQVAGPDGRWVATIDVEEGTRDAIRTLFPPQIAESVEEAKGMIAASLARAASGLALVNSDSSEELPIAS